MTSPPRAILYLRQSTYREESISLELQEFEGRAYAARNGYEVVGVEGDPGISGRTWNRPAVQRVMKMIDDGDADVIVLWKWSRLSRSRLDWAVAADRVESAGGRIESATEPIDATTSTGRFARGMMTEFAAFESERIGDVWRESHARRIRNGLPAN
ncbi:MAG TPA: recombinase family protein, partial [Galbitalea sp.]